jgi:hypothetical protein
MPANRSINQFYFTDPINSLFLNLISLILNQGFVYPLQVIRQDLLASETEPFTYNFLDRLTGVDRLIFTSGFSLFVVDVLSATNPGCGGSDKTHYNREDQYLYKTTVKSGVDKLRKESS